MQREHRRFTCPVQQVIDRADDHASLQLIGDFKYGIGKRREVSRFHPVDRVPLSSVQIERNRLERAPRVGTGRSAVRIN